MTWTTVNVKSFAQYPHGNECIIFYAELLTITYAELTITRISLHPHRHTRTRKQQYQEKKDNQWGGGMEIFNKHVVENNDKMCQFETQYRLENAAIISYFPVCAYAFIVAVCWLQRGKPTAA